MGAAFVHGQGAPRNSPPLGTLPQTLFTSDYQVRVSAVASGLSHPWSLAFLPDGDMLVTERNGRLRIIRAGVLDPAPIAGVPGVRAAVLGGLLEVALHPRFAQNQLLYLTYTKTREDNLTTTALARARFDGKALERGEGNLRRQQLEQVDDELRRAAGLRSQRLPVHDRRRAAGAGARAEHARSRRQGAAAA